VTGNCSRGCLGIHLPVLPLADRNQRRRVDPQETPCAAHGFQKEERQNIFLEERAASGAIRVRAAAVRTVETASKH
jgi:hypothetical protein